MECEENPIFTATWMGFFLSNRILTFCWFHLLAYFGESSSSLACCNVGQVMACLSFRTATTLESATATTRILFFSTGNFTVGVIIRNPVLLSGFFTDRNHDTQTTGATNGLLCELNSSSAHLCCSLGRFLCAALSVCTLFCVSHCSLSLCTAASSHCCSCWTPKSENCNHNLGNQNLILIQCIES